MKKRTLLSLALMFIMLLFIVSSCTCQNPLSGLSWGKAILRGQVITEYKNPTTGKTTRWGLKNVMISTDVGNDYVYTIAAKDPTVLSSVDKHELEVGEFEMEVRFRIGSTAKSKKVAVTAYRDTFNAPATTSNVLLVDGQPSIPVYIKMTEIVN